ncbi:transposase [Streptomyces sp. NBC_01619]|nr:transposase [Streptomyces sp. NBC_01619]
MAAQDERRDAGSGLRLNMCSGQGTHIFSTKAVRMSLLHRDARREPLAELSCFRGEFYSCLTSRSDALFGLADAVLCGDGPVRSLAELSLVGEHCRGHGGFYAAVARGRVDSGRLWRALAAVPLSVFGVVTD